jgi:hypothetical protein
MVVEGCLPLVPLSQGIAERNKPSMGVAAT